MAEELGLGTPTIKLYYFSDKGFTTPALVYEIQNELYSLIPSPEQCENWKGGSQGKERVLVGVEL